MKKRHLAMLVGLATAATTATTIVTTTPASASPSTYYVSTSGSDSNPGTLSAPWRTVKKGLQSLYPGDTLYVRGGTYVENDTSVTTRAGSSTARVTVAAYPGERPVLQGLLWLHSPSYWTFDGLNVTWNSANPSTSHMVRLINGVGWVWKDSEVWGAHSYADMLVAGTTAGQPANWQVVNNCIHDTYPSNNANQDQLIYANTDVTAGAGLNAHNLLFNATNGMGVKLGGATATSGGGANVTVRYNTIYNTSQNILVSWQSHDNKIYGNILDKVGTNYGNIRGYQLTGVNNVAYGNVGYAAKMFLLNDAGYLGVTNGGNNSFPVNPQFDNVTSCTGFHPQNAAAQQDGYRSTVR